MKSILQILNKTCSLDEDKYEDKEGWRNQMWRRGNAEGKNIEIDVGALVVLPKVEGVCGWGETRLVYR